MIRAADNNGVPVLQLYEGIGKYSDGTGIDAVDFLAELDAVAGAPRIQVRINSPGGSVFEGITILNRLIQHDSQIDIYIDGIAASIASVICMAGDTVYAAESSTVMIHSASGVVVGPATQMDSTAEVLRQLDGTIAMLYAKRTGLRADYFRELMKAETWLTAYEALDLGLVDRIIETKTPATSSWSASATRRKYATDTDSLAARLDELRVDAAREMVAKLNGR